MAKKKKQKPQAQAKPDTAPENSAISESKPEVPKFEIGKKGDEFDIKYSRATSLNSREADHLLQDLGRESKADKFNFLSLALPLVIIVVLSLSFGFVSRGDIEEMFSVKFNTSTVIDGSYFAQLDDIYNETLPFKDGIQKLGAWLGFVEAPKAPPQELPEEEPVIPDEPIETPVVTTTEATTTEEITTTPPTTTEAPTTSETEATIPETYTLYATATVNIRLAPSSDSAIMGYFEAGDAVEMIELSDDGWAKIYYNGMIAYCYGEYLTDNTPEEIPDVTVSIIEGEVPETFIMITTSSLNVRSLPTTDSDVITQFRRGTEVMVIEMLENGWAAIYYDGGVAYCYGEYLTEAVETEAEVTQAPEESDEVETEEPESYDESDETVPEEDIEQAEEDIQIVSDEVEE